MKSNLAEKIIDLINRGSTQTEIAAKAKVSQSTINKIINTDTKHTIATCKKFAAAYGWPLLDLISNEDNTDYAENHDNRLFLVREHLPDDLKRLFDAYRSLSDGDKKAALFLVEGLAKESRAKDGGGSNLTEKKSA